MKRKNITKGAKKNERSPVAISGRLRKNDSEQNYKAKMVNIKRGINRKEET